MALEPSQRSRLAASYAPGCWVAGVVHAIRASRAAGASVASPDHYLGAAWAPGVPTRYPDVVVIGSPAADNAIAELLVHVAAGSKLWLAGRDDVDFALAAEILLVADRNLEAYQRDALARFVNAERERTRADVAARYSDRDPAFERFRAQLVGARPGAAKR